MTFEVASSCETLSVKSELNIDIGDKNDARDALNQSFESNLEIYLSGDDAVESGKGEV